MDLATLAALCGLGAAQPAPSTPPTAIECETASPLQPNRLAVIAQQITGPDSRAGIARVAFAEAGNQGDSGLAGVVYTILNRLGSGRWGATVDAVLNAPHQFEPVMRAGGSWRRLPAVAPAQQARIDTIINLALDGRLPDLTGGARFFQNARIVAQRAAAGQVSARLVHFGGATPTAVIGAHSFYAETGRRRASTASVSARLVQPNLLASNTIFVGENRAGEGARTLVDGAANTMPIGALTTVSTAPETPQIIASSAEQPALALARADSSPAPAYLGNSGRGLFVLADGTLAEDRRPEGAAPVQR